MPPLLPQSAPRHEAEAQNPNLINIGTPCAASPRGSVAIISHKDAENAPHSTLARFGPVFSLILGLVRGLMLAVARSVSPLKNFPQSLQQAGL
jgi:hypothetical protein